MNGSAALPLPSSPEGSGATPPLTALTTNALESPPAPSPNLILDQNSTLATLAAPSPKPNVHKKRRLCPPQSRNYSLKNKEELKVLLRNKNLKVGGNKDELIDRLEKSDRGQTLLKFPINVPPIPIPITRDQHPPPPLPGTPKRRRQDREDSEDEEIQQSQKEARMELRIVSHLEQDISHPDEGSKGVKTKKDSEGDVHPIGNEVSNKKEKESNEMVPTERKEGDEDPRQEIISSSSQNIINREGEGPEIIKTSSQNHPT